ncbi:uncharacterized protein LOC120214249 [Hibiscus syriacus]|uniref:uncharacterized protein LOC120214249 n=1 Tax=Hibiscus syriacus TaxID=106335 RepID=UPI001924EDA3|nr:uncharacterized protein LOC120214249 [Hibiscus syriacus]
MANFDGRPIPPPNRQQKRHTWERPITNTIKNNVDGTCKQMEKVSAIGIVVRDHNGLVLGGMCKPIEQTFTAESAEADAFTQGIKFAVENGWTNATIKGDAITIVSRLVNHKEDVSTIGLILNEAV